jgi:hypothetical protein
MEHAEELPRKITTRMSMQKLSPGLPEITDEDSVSVKGRKSLSRNSHSADLLATAPEHQHKAKSWLSWRLSVSQKVHISTEDGFDDEPITTHKSFDELPNSTRPTITVGSRRSDVPEDHESYDEATPEIENSRGSGHFEMEMSPPKRSPQKMYRHQGILKARMTPAGTQEHYFILENKQLLVFKGTKY